MQVRECPRCGAALTEDTYLEEMRAAPGRLPAYRLRHPKDGGRWCVAYVGPEAGQSEGEAPPAFPTALPAGVGKAVPSSQARLLPAARLPEYFNS